MNSALTRRIALSLLLAAGLCSAQSAPYDRIYVFGDSYSDTGAGYVDGNGPTAVGYLAQRMGLTLAPSTAASPGGKSLNFAVSGAQTGAGEGRTIKDSRLGCGMHNQADDFAALVRDGAVQFAPESTLFYIAGGLNDKQLTGETTVANLEGIIRQLYQLGGRHFLIALMPTEIPNFSEVGQRLNPFLERIPGDMAKELPSADIHLSKWGPFFDEVMRNPDRYGITNTTDQCAGRALFDQDATPCATPDAHYYYHSGHPSTAVHKIVGDKLYDEVLAMKQ
ncbi:MAG: SGNH/GDSL hydrolase family protein [Acidobacteria bacterium]|nr:SGNH/GDSL hydrolase family protein [Acidobacteriota bacterium]